MKIAHLNSGNVEDVTCPSIYITASHGVSVGLNQENHLMLFDEDHAVVLGPFNQRQVDNLCEYLQRLKIHLPA